MSVVINGRKKSLNYWMARCNGVKKCIEYDHVLSNVCVKRNCKSHPGVALETTGNCAVGFISANIKDKRRWIGGIIRTDVYSLSL